MISTDTPANVIDEGVQPHERAAAWRRDPRTGSLACLGIYLAASGFVLGAAGHTWLVLAHVAGIVVARLTMHPRGTVARTIGDLLPLVVAPALYGEVPLLIAAIGTGYHDIALQRWELVLFGTQLSRTLAVALPFTWLSEALHAGYLAYYPLIFVPPLLLFVRGERRGFAETVFALTIVCTVCWAMFVLFPVEGPRYWWSANAAPIGPVRRATLQILARGSARGAAFPSSHMAVSVAQTLMAWRWQRRIAWTLAAITLLVGLGAVYGGFHYATDMLAGAALGAIVATAVGRVGGR